MPSAHTDTSPFSPQGVSVLIVHFFFFKFNLARHTYMRVGFRRDTARRKDGRTGCDGRRLISHRSLAGCTRREGDHCVFLGATSICDEEWAPQCAGGCYPHRMVTRDCTLRRRSSNCSESQPDLRNYSRKPRRSQNSLHIHAASTLRVSDALTAHPPLGPDSLSILNSIANF
ncbi:hypothetical protein DFH11DRAFT_813191 [Phellopilus nigrolimitatus]|nr:hypothetical protein DFH11DRAFT_813191 [Phellopilus nigrolimitatus]